MYEPPSGLYCTTEKSPRYLRRPIVRPRTRPNRACKIGKSPGYLRRPTSGVRMRTRPKRACTTGKSPGYLRRPTVRPCTRLKQFVGPQNRPGTYGEGLLGTHGDPNGAARPGNPPGYLRRPTVRPCKGPLYCRCTRTRAVRYPGLPEYLRRGPVRYLRRPKRVLTTEVSPGYLRGPTVRPCKGPLYCRCSRTRTRAVQHPGRPGYLRGGSVRYLRIPKRACTT